MQITREMRIGAGALAFIGAVVWMIPPTTPVAPVGTAVRPHRSGLVAPVTDYAGGTGYEAPVYVPPPVGEPPAPVAREAAPPPRLAQAEPVQPRWRDTGSNYADEDPEALPDRAFETGYRWAEENGIEERRDCRRWRGSPAEDGCRQYVRDAGDDDRGVAWEPQ
jgi:hypothetical protein